MFVPPEGIEDFSQPEQPVNDSTRLDEAGTTL